MLSFLSLEVKNANDVDSRKNAKHYLCILYKMIGQTRDIIDGKGEYNLTYMMIYAWYDFYPDLAKFILYNLVISETGDHPYGSWKDMKYFCNYCKNKGNSYHPLINECINICNSQLRWDELSPI
jgi:hypothetical protein